MGAVFASNVKAYRRWTGRRRHPGATTGPGGGPLSDAQLEAAVMRLAGMFPENVVREVRG